MGKRTVVVVSDLDHRVVKLLVVRQRLCSFH